MLTIRRADERGHANHGWLDSFHTFSFADYYDPAHMGFRGLRVINDDRIAGGGGFGTHPHRDMEIITYVLDGAVRHRDSMGNGSVIKPGDVQRMSAGTGVRHSELNDSQTDELRLLQIWIMPAKQGTEPGYEQKMFEPSEKQGHLRLVASPTGENGSVTVHADARLYAALLGPGDRVDHVVPPGRHAWVQVARGKVRVDGHELSEGDGAHTSSAGAITLDRGEDAEVLIFDLA
ncbi:MAG: pirin family protein [Myxococcales bacterium]|nr:pirin family protein [Myxococcales bacterium]